MTEPSKAVMYGPHTLLMGFNDAPDDIHERFQMAVDAAFQLGSAASTTALQSAQAEIARLREALERYATDLCEMGRHHDCCGRLSPVECGGCAARAELIRQRMGAKP